MKKILTLFLAASLGCFAQNSVEGFEGETFPPEGWAVYDNGIGQIKSWEQSVTENLFTPAYEGEHAAFLDRENVLDTDGLPQDWLVMPLITVTGERPAIHFYSRLSINGDDGSILRLMMSTDSDSSDLGVYTVVMEWTEYEINPEQMYYNELYVPIPLDFVGEQVYFAFVMEADNGDRWLIDNVSFVEDYCPQPYDLNATVTVPGSINLSWTDDEASAWEVEFLMSGEAPTGTGFEVNETNYTVTELTTGDYKFYVRALCSETSKSLWSGPYTITLHNGIYGVVSYDSDSDEVCDTLYEGAQVTLTINGGTQVTSVTDSSGYYLFYPLLFTEADISISVEAPEGFEDIESINMPVNFNTQPQVSVDVCFVELIDQLGYNEFEDFNNIILYPNPVTNRLYFKMPSNEQLTTVQVFNINGKLCIEENNPLDNVDVSKLQPGFYFIKMSTATGTKNMKFVKQ
ncbi:choice-of-anchor J domain-containing protein [Flavobacterium rakeshii]|uniref:T9SS-dependent choice-of-anchor J family protein n=1 Tax=Flavobacterium rakeshii TaxID=1038845 RepID=UPI002E7BA9A9|nr:choice-of-anchor J domain-containing protein [Flavobacterium rakeshii]MEE1899028.1 choice-of-anchor J domain-containing protein [Flavobacterium rakeshii]